MKYQLSQNYDVDNRYRGLERAVDDTAAKNFLNEYVGRMREEQKPNYGSDAATEDRFIINGAGGNNYSFRNSFRVKQ